MAIASDYRARGDSFVEAIRNGAHHGVFDALVLTQGFHSFVPYHALEKHYRRSEEVLLHLPFDRWRVEVWHRRPKKENSSNHAERD